MSYTPTRANVALSSYNVSPSSLRRFRAAMARARSGGNNAHIVCSGDSTTVGTGAASYSTTWPQRLAALLVEKGVTTTRGTGVTCTDLLTKTGGPGTGVSIGSYNAAVGASGSFLNGTGATLTVTATTDQFVVWYHTVPSFGGTMTVTMDGAGQTSINCNQAQSIAQATYTPGSQGSHTLVLTGPAGAYGYILGVEARANGATGGVKISTLARGGKYSSDLADSSGQGAGSSIPHITALASDLLIINMGINDYGGQIALATYKTNIQTAITAQRAAGGDVLLVGWTPQQSSLSIAQASYIQQLRDLCDANDVPMINLHDRWTSYTVSSASPFSMYADGTHPNDKGYADIALAVYETLRSAGIGL